MAAWHPRLRTGHGAARHLDLDQQAGRSPFQRFPCAAAGPGGKLRPRHAGSTGPILVTGRILSSSTPSSSTLSSHAASIEQAVGAFGLLREFFQGAVIVDARTRITWIDQRYRELLKLADDFDPVGLPIEEVIPHSLMRRVVETGKPILIDIMKFDDRQFVVCRIPLKDQDGRIEGAIGFVIYARVDYLLPLLDKFDHLQTQLIRAQAALAPMKPDSEY